MSAAIKIWRSAALRRSRRSTLGVKPKTARRGTGHGAGLGAQGWVVERTFAHMQRMTEGRQSLYSLPLYVIVSGAGGLAARPGSCGKIVGLGQISRHWQSRSARVAVDGWVLPGRRTAGGTRQQVRVCAPPDCAATEGCDALVATGVVPDGG